MDLRDAVTFHMLTLSSEGASLQTQRHYKFYWELLIEGLEALGMSLDPMSLDTNNVRQFLHWYRGRVNKNSPRQGDSSVRVLALRANTFSKFLEREDIIPADLLHKLKPPRVAKILREPFSEVELNAMWGACRQSPNAVRDEALFLLLLSTGMRIGEASSLTLDRLRLEERMAIVSKNGKGRRERVVPLGSTDKRDGGRVLRALRAWLAERLSHGHDAGYVFLSRDGRPWSSEGASEAIQRLGEAAGVPNPIPHRLRHGFCTDYLTQYPGDEIGLRRIVGHLSHDVLAEYVAHCDTVIADRAGRVAMADRVLSSQPPPRPVLPPRKPPTKVASLNPAEHLQALIASIRTDDTLRRTLLEALAGVACRAASKYTAGSPAGWTRFA
jgi:site-specific recombinase XerD